MEIKTTDLTKKFGDVTAVDHMDLTMTGGVYGLLGVNGAGKTTLMRMLCTLLQPTEGSITCNGKDIFKMGADYRKMLGYLPQEFGFYPEFTVKDYLLYIASIKGGGEEAGAGTAGKGWPCESGGPEDEEAVRGDEAAGGDCPGHAERPQDLGAG